MKKGGETEGIFLLVDDLLGRAREVGNEECAGEGRVGSGRVCGEATQGHWDRSEEFGPTGRDSAHVGLLWSEVDDKEVGSCGRAKNFFCGADSNRVWGEACIKTLIEFIKVYRLTLTF